MSVQQYYAYLAMINRREREMDKQQFEQGCKDCEAGVPHQSGRGESYDYGYSWAYAEGERNAAK